MRGLSCRVRCKIVSSRGLPILPLVVPSTASISPVSNQCRLVPKYLKYLDK
nr:MAG TPA: hypothetical protein [Caudoviricetes sp.]DAK77771.1 MAG TPA: hypothetical protein [Caudoviricetes sp.]DAX52902.1 MAG TPA: hypothetical protein [Caudoviricetes sp.]